MADILVIGGGAAGLTAALFAARGGAKGTLLEQNEKLGKKVYISGKGRCNLTNDCDRDTFLSQVPRNPRFLYAALSFFSPQDMMTLLESAGCPVTVQRGRRVFPATEKASDVTKALASLMHAAGVRVRLNTAVRSLETEGGLVTAVRTASGERIPADAVILCTGGFSYPSTGSTGDGYRFAAEAGHTVLSPFPVLVGLETAEDWPRSLQGLSLKNVTLTLALGRKVLYTELGEMLFTHFGVSGPLVLTMSSYLPEDLSNVRMEIDLKPALDEQTLDARLLRDFRELSRRQLATVMDGLEPHSLGMKLLEIAGFSPAQPVNSVTQEERRRLEGIVKHVPLTPAARRGFDEAIITRGGVSVKDIDPSTMQSKRTPGLYFAGEMIDVDAETGGFNLQIAFSTGALAGMSAAKEELA